MNLHDTYSANRLEKASQVILSHTSAPTYRQLKSILDKNMDVPKPQKETKASEKPARRGFQRGADYFGGASHVES